MFVWGGVWEDFRFLHIEPGYYEEYGPFENYQDAYAVWKAKVWLNVDNALHRLFITHADPDYTEAWDEKDRMLYSWNDY